MDISDINRIANRKKVTANAEKLREKVSRETEQVIKLKVAQDTAYWDLNEKLKQVEAQRDRLQQNLVELQMQYEAISAQYQDELRGHEETRNKVKTTHEFFTTLENCIEELLVSLDRFKEDKVMAVNMFSKANQEVKHIIQDIDVAYNRTSLNILTLVNSLERSEEREANANKALQETRARAEALERQACDADERAKDAKADLSAAYAECDRLTDELQKGKINF